jgi:hypothetical protein
VRLISGDFEHPVYLVGAKIMKLIYEYKAIEEVCNTKLQAKIDILFKKKVQQSYVSTPSS